MAAPELSHSLRIGELSRRTGVKPELLRAWERRYGLLQPARTPGGFRLYSAEDEARIRRMQAHLTAGLSAAEGARLATVGVNARVPDGSLYGALRWGPHRSEARILPKRTLVALSHAVEDECSLRAERGLLVGAFQERRHYAHARSRWRDLAAGAQRALVFADFAAARIPPDAPAEVPVAIGDPLEREWAIAWLGSRSAVALVGRELPGEAPEPDSDRRFELVWSADPEAVREVLRRAVARADRTAPEIAQTLRGDLEAVTQPELLDTGFVVSLASRMIDYLTHPSPHERAHE